MDWMRQMIVWGAVLIGLTSIGAGLVVDKFVAKRPYPLVGFPHGADAKGDERCDVYLTALFLVRDTLRLTYRNVESAVSKGFQNIRSRKCYIGQRTHPKALKVADHEFVSDFKKSGLSLIDAAPREPFWLSPSSLLRSAGIMSSGSNPSSSMSVFRSMVEEYFAINSGRGLKYYAECDYNIRKEPEFSYYIANYFIRQELGPAAERFSESDFRRIERCGYREVMETEIAERLQNWHIPFSPKISQ